MPTHVMVAVLAAALLHAGWNVVVKSSPDAFLDVVLLAGGAAVLAATVLPFLPAPLPASWPFAAASGAIHVAYFGLLAAAYRRHDLSVAYPIMRGTAPLLVAVASAAVAGEAPTAGAWLGVLLVSGGLVVVAAGRRRAGPAPAAVLLALVNAVVIAGYTLVDGLGVRRAGDALAYTGWVFVLTAAGLGAITAIARREDLLDHLRARWRQGLAGGAASLASYALALWAMARAPIAPVAALRETSILFGTALAALFLGERFGAARVLATAAILAGVVTLRLVG